jgi:hypothetical protein
VTIAAPPDREITLGGVSAPSRTSAGGAKLMWCAGPTEIQVQGYPPLDVVLRPSAATWIRCGESACSLR